MLINVMYEVRECDATNESQCIKFLYENGLMKSVDRKSTLKFKSGSSALMYSIHCNWMYWII